MSHTIIVHTTEYAPWEEDADEREVISRDEETLSFEFAFEVSAYLKREGLQSPSNSGLPYTLNTWLSDVDPYEHPYTGVLTERSAHAVDVHPAWWAAIIRTVRWPGH